MAKTLTIKLPPALYEELHLAAADCGELDEHEVCSPEDFARECIESVLASRRLERLSA
jgi:hypothetical protein